MQCPGAWVQLELDIHIWSAVHRNDAQPVKGGTGVSQETLGRLLLPTSSTCAPCQCSLRAQRRVVSSWEEQNSRVRGGMPLATGSWHL